ncbi:MAG: hypothetical protein ACRDOE_02605, partial [Streptosporangiaceae bacterium]
MDESRSTAITPRRQGRRPAAPPPTAIAQELWRRGDVLELTVRQAAVRTGVSPSVISGTSSIGRGSAQATAFR